MSWTPGAWSSQAPDAGVTHVGQNDQTPSPRAVWPAVHPGGGMGARAPRRTAPGLALVPGMQEMSVGAVARAVSALCG